MRKHNKEWWKEMLVAILVGACVSFLTTLAEGVAELLNGYANNLAGGVVSTIMLTVRRHLV